MVIEITSKKTRREDLRTKPRKYELIGVREFFLFDPRKEYLKPFLQVFRAEGGKLVEGEAARVEGDALVLTSEVMGLDLVGMERVLRLRDRKTSAILLPARERADAAEAEVRRLREEITRLRGGRGR